MCHTSTFGPLIFFLLFFLYFFALVNHSVGIYCLCLKSHPYKQGGGGGVQRGGEGEGEIEEGRVAAFRNTDTQRGFILSLKIQPNASSPGSKPNVCARFPSPLVTCQPRPPGFEDVPGPVCWTSAFSCSQRDGVCARCENLPLLRL